MAEVVNRPAMAMQFFMSKGLKPWQAAGLVGTFQAESGRNLNPEAIGDNGSAFGIYQARGRRFDIIKNIAAKKGTTWRDFNVQLEAAWADLNGGESATLARLRRSRNVTEAAEAAISFERPKGWSQKNPRGGHNWSGRLAYAKALTGAAPSAGGETEKKKEPVYDKAAKDDRIPDADRDPMEVASEIDFSDEGDFEFTSEGFDGLPYEPLPPADDEGLFSSIIPDPPGDVGGFADPFASLYSASDDGEDLIPDPPGPIDEFATFEPLPAPPTTFRDRVLGRRPQSFEEEV